MTDKFVFYSKSANAKPGKGSGETLTGLTEYNELSEIKDWRHMLSNFYKTPFQLDDELWNSVEHFFHAVKFRDKKTRGKKYEYYKSFTLNSGSPWSVEPVLAKQAGKAGRISDTTGKIYDKKIEGVKIPKDVQMREDFYRRGIDRKLQTIAFLAKFSQNADLKRALLETKEAELWHYVGRGAPNQYWENLMKVRKCIRKYDNVYNLAEASKMSSELVTKLLG